MQQVLTSTTDPGTYSRLLLLMHMYTTFRNVSATRTLYVTWEGGAVVQCHVNTCITSGANYVYVWLPSEGHVGRAEDFTDAVQPFILNSVAAQFEDLQRRVGGEEVCQQPCSIT